jgi:Fe2+ transport system protein FeoA
MQCPLCGHEFDDTDLSCHTSCAFNKQCAIICCPNCGYQMVDESKSRIATFLKRRLLRQKYADLRPHPICSLSRLHPGESATVVSVDTEKQERLSVFGLIPGAHLTLHQRQPAYVLRIGFTELSIESAIADEILVEVI